MIQGRALRVSPLSMWCSVSLLDKESPAGGLRRSIRQTDTICLCGAGRPVRQDPVASPQDGTPTKQVSDKTRPQNRYGSLWARMHRQDNETPALNALKALRGAPISMGRGEIPVELRPAAIRFCLFNFQINLLLFCLRIIRKLSISSRQTRNGAVQ